MNYISKYLAILLIALAAPAAHAQPTAQTDNARVALVSEVATIAPGEVFWVGLRLVPREGWHTYWRNPGDSGQPTEIDWVLPEGFSAGEIHWPAPEAIPYGPLVNYGYERAHVLAVPITPPATLPMGEALTLTAHAYWLICEDICIPEQATLSLGLGVGAAAVADEPGRATLQAAQQEWPLSGAWSGIYRAADGRFNLRIEGVWPLDEQAYFFPFAEGVVKPSAPQRISFDGDAIYVSAERSELALGDTVSGVLVMGQGARRTGYVINAVPGAVALPDTASLSAEGQKVADLPLLSAILFAFLGGILLNLMPCVFPVLSLKALALVNAAGETQAQMRREGLYYTGGIVVSFIAVAGALLALRAGGDVIGWGFQLQMPLFVAALAIVLFLVGLSLSGYFVFGGRVMGIGQAFTTKRGPVGAFFTGVLATVVATPCTAPFMAPALGFALVQPAAIALAVFVSLGVGLAFPFLMISWVPGLAGRLPAPGPWMERFKQFLAFPVYATVIWLVWVLGHQVGMNGVAAMLVAMMLSALALWVGRMGHERPTKVMTRGLALVCAGGVLAALVYAADQPAPPAQAAATPEGLRAGIWSDAEVARLQAQGRPVFVNFTAAWCVTCLANEQIAFNSADVQAYFVDNDIAYLKGDWTSRDDVITNKLAAFGRSGVPLYLYYPSGGGAPVVLPQLFTPASLLARLQQAGGA